MDEMRSARMAPAVSAQEQGDDIDTHMENGGKSDGKEEIDIRALVGKGFGISSSAPLASSILSLTDFPCFHN
jgi:hypothetical protein